MSRNWLFFVALADLVQEALKSPRRSGVAADTGREGKRSKMTLFLRPMPSQVLFSASSSTGKGIPDHVGMGFWFKKRGNFNP